MLITGFNNTLVSSLSSLGKINQSFSVPCFRGSNSVEKDTFEFNNNIQNVTIKDMDGNDVTAQIKQIPSNSKFNTLREKKFEMSVNGKILGFATVRDNMNNNKLDLLHLYTEEANNRHYKGAGTELLKSVVKESMARGYKGKVYVQASHAFASPLVFYYKNNFVISKPADTRLFGFIENHNAAIRYAAEKNIPIDDVLSRNYSTAFMNLDEKGAKAFLENKRLYKDRQFETVNQKEIKGINYCANFIQSVNDNEYFLLITNENAKACKANLVVTLEEKENKAGKKHFEIVDIFGYEFSEEEARDFAVDTLQKLEKEKDFDKTEISKNINKETRFWRKGINF